MIRSASAAAPQNILLIRLKSIGDVLFTLPAVQVVRENFPAAKIHFLVSKEFASIVEGFADVDEIIPLDRSVYRAGNWLAAAAGTTRLLRDLRRKQFSHVLDFQGYAETEALAWWTGAPERWGNVYHPSRGWSYTRTSARDKKIHPAEWNLQLLRRCGLNPGNVRNEFRLPSTALSAAENFLAGHKIDRRQPVLFLQPFTSSAWKNWPVENFLQVAAHFRAQGVQIIFGGGPGDLPKLESARAAGHAVAAGAPLLVSAALTKFSTVVLGGDTGLLHFAVALSRRVVMLMVCNAPGSPHPFQHPDWAVTSRSKTVAEIPVETVIAACAQAFSERAGNVSC